MTMKAPTARVANKGIKKDPFSPADVENPNLNQDPRKLLGWTSSDGELCQLLSTDDLK